MLAYAVNLNERERLELPGRSRFILNAFGTIRNFVVQNFQPRFKERVTRGGLVTVEQQASFALQLFALHFPKRGAHEHRDGPPGAVYAC
jgi:hypothetical protein